MKRDSVTVFSRFGVDCDTSLSIFFRKTDQAYSLWCEDCRDVCGNCDYDGRFCLFFWLVSGRGMESVGNVFYMLWNMCDSQYRCFRAERKTGEP